jgi:hypothetical protein
MLKNRIKRAAFIVTEIECCRLAHGQTTSVYFLPFKRRVKAGMGFLTGKRHFRNIASR